MFFFQMNGIKECVVYIFRNKNICFIVILFDFHRINKISRCYKNVLLLPINVLGFLSFLFFEVSNCNFGGIKFEFEVSQPTLKSLVKLNALVTWADSIHSGKGTSGLRVDTGDYSWIHFHVLMYGIT
jgi:hypothetical protein